MSQYKTFPGPHGPPQNSGADFGAGVDLNRGIKFQWPDSESTPAEQGHDLPGPVCI